MNCGDNLRDCQAWKDERLPMSTSSNEAAKMYDAGLYQLIGWFEDERYDGLAGTCQKMLNADQTFIMGKVFTYGLDLIGTGKTSRLDTILSRQLADLENTCESANDREKLHVQAIKHFADGNLSNASLVWENILIDYPTDVLALKLAHDTYFYLGESSSIRDSVARVLPYFSKKSTFYGYLKGMLAFGQEETNLLKQAEDSANEALSMNKNDCWATHALAHVHEMTGDTEKGMKLLYGLESDWKSCGLLACHLYWHAALYSIENGNYDKALELFDQQIGNKCRNSGGMLDLVDASSLLYRLQLEGINVGNRWEDVFNVAYQHINDHVLSFNDAHFCMAYLGAQKQEVVESLTNSMNSFAKLFGSTESGSICESFGLKIVNALIAYSNGCFEDTANLLFPIKHKLIQIGGSHAQRDVFDQILIHSCLKSSSPKHNRLARNLLHERKCLKPLSPLTDRLMARLLSHHDE